MGAGLSTLANIAIRTSVVYLALFIGIRLLGKRAIGQLTPVDLVFILLISNAVQNAMTGPDNSLAGGLCAAAVLFAWNLVLSYARGNKFFKIVEGSPTILAVRGEVLPENLKRENVSQDELMAAIREHGFAGIKDVEMAILEIDGTISIIHAENGGESPRQRKRFRYLRKK